MGREPTTVTRSNQTEPRRDRASEPPSGTQGFRWLAARRHELPRAPPRAIQLLDLVRRCVAREVAEARAADVADPVRAARGEENRGVRSDHTLRPPVRDLAAALEDEVHRVYGAMLM